MRGANASYGDEQPNTGVTAKGAEGAKGYDWLR
jgi:hypothetical protein